MNGSIGPYAALVPVAVNILVNLAKPLFNGVRDQQTHDAAIRALAYLLSALIAAGFALAGGGVDLQGAVNVFLLAIAGGSTSIALYHVAQKAPATATPYTAAGVGISAGSSVPTPLAPMPPAQA